MLSKLPRIIPVTDFRQDAANILEQLQGSAEPTIVTQRGKPAAVLLSIDAYERAERDRQILLLLARGEQEIAHGEGEDLDAVLGAADALLDPKR